MWSLKQHIFSCKETDYKFVRPPLKSSISFWDTRKEGTTKNRASLPYLDVPTVFFLFLSPLFPFRIFPFLVGIFNIFFVGVKAKKIGLPSFDVRALSFFSVLCIVYMCIKAFFFQISFMLDSRVKCPWAIESDEGLPCVSGATHPSMGFYFHVRGSLIYLIYLEGISSRV